MPGPPGTSSLRGTRILLVEDEPAVRQTITRILQNFGCPVVPAGNGEEALEVLEKTQNRGFDLLLMDLQMPQMGPWR